VHENHFSGNAVLFPIENCDAGIGNYDALGALSGLLGLGFRGRMNLLALFVHIVPMTRWIAWSAS
jgi:hypothetical protein